MKRVFILTVFASLLAGCGQKSVDPPLKTGESLVPLKSGENGNISYGLFHAITHSRSGVLTDCDLILILRDYGAQFVSMNKSSSEDFAVRDSRGTNIAFALAAPPESLTVGKATVIHLRVRATADNTQPWTLDFKAKGSEYATQLSLKDIRL